MIIPIIYVVSNKFHESFYSWRQDEKLSPRCPDRVAEYDRRVSAGNVVLSGPVSVVSQCLHCSSPYHHTHAVTHNTNNCQNIVSMWFRQSWIWGYLYPKDHWKPWKAKSGNWSIGHSKVGNFNQTKTVSRPMTFDWLLVLLNHRASV